MTGPECFSPSYEVARARFRSAATALGFRLESHASIVGQDLTVDVAFGGDDRASSLVIVSSGLHGVEGFLGSAIQLGLLGAAAPLPAAVRLVLIHAIDPFGFSHLRRWDEGNVDLNRNFLIDGDGYSGSPPLYGRLDPVLNPKHRPRRLDTFPIEALALIARHGMAALKRTIAGGQYDFPLGLFYGGKGMSASHRQLAENLPRWVGGAERIVHVDVHTGLGPRGGLSLLLDDGVSADRARTIADRFGSFDVQWQAAGIAYPTRGDLGAWCRSRFEGRAYDYLCAEFGTYPGTKVLAALRAENQAHQWGRPGDASTSRAKRRLMEAFAPVSPAWREATVSRGLELTLRAIEVARP